ncbi:MAG: ABC transporter permease [Armatimonadota bacterium]
MGVIARYGSLSKQFAARDLRLRYEKSALGFLWALLNPLVMIGVYTFVFSLVLKQGIENYPVFLVSALLPWNFLARCVGTVSPLVYQSSSLVTRAAFPSESILLGGMAAALFDFVLELGLFALILALLGMPISPGVLALPAIMALFAMFVMGLVFVFAVGHVFFRDTQYVVGILLTAWFFLSPIFYSPESVPVGMRFLYSLNPMVHFTGAFRAALYLGQSPPWTTFAGLFALSAAVLTLGWLFFDRYRYEFAEVL